MKKYLKNEKYVSLTIIFVFIISRIFIWFNPPTDFTEIIYSYMPYAHLWASGVKPYLEQWYEYPPATIPLFYFPHLVDQLTASWWVHIDYGNTYRFQLMLIDVGLFALIWQTLKKIQPKRKIIFIALLYYIFVTAKANHFIYDTMDLVFAATITLATTAPIIWKSSVGTLTMWLSYFLGISLKLLNAPLGLVYAILEKDKWKQQFVFMGVAFLIIWAVPLILFRSSLQVMLVYHQMRGLQVDSAGAIIVRVINSFTHSESIIEIYKNYEVSGPITNQVLKLVGIVFPAALLLFIAYASKIAWQLKKSIHNNWRISITLGFILLLMITSKVLSLPFMIWSIPLLTIFPFKNVKQQLMMLVPSTIIISLTLSHINDFQLWLFSTAVWVGVIRTMLFLWMFGWWIKLDSQLIKES